MRGVKIWELCVFGFMLIAGGITAAIVFWVLFLSPNGGWMRGNSVTLVLAICSTVAGCLGIVILLSLGRFPAGAGLTLVFASIGCLSSFLAGMILAFFHYKNAAIFTLGVYLMALAGLFLVWACSVAYRCDHEDDSESEESEDGWCGLCPDGVPDSSRGRANKSSRDHAIDLSGSDADLEKETKYKRLSDRERILEVIRSRKKTN
ncbi:hypothetical protein IKF15_02865 [Candidatus Saccharibacteria bacterium]|nr:hypothetical protein [Candidatus Saccharibacteria bacterium]